MLHLSGLCGARGDLAEAEQRLYAVLAADPCCEEAAQRLMTLLAADERHAEATRVYHTLEAALRNDLALAPAPETTDLFQRLLRRRTLPGAIASPTPTGAAAVGLTNLPLPISSFVGRQQDQAAIKDLLAAHRLLTLTGAGGCGKTRLAQQVALDRQTAYPDGVWLVELAAQTDPVLAATTVARALGLSEDVTGPPQQDLAAITAPKDKTVALLLAFLRPRSLLLLLDNCEHLLGACAALADTLLGACPRLRILATSREPLGVAGEAVWRVPSLPFPTASDAPNQEALLGYDAITLFVQRARLARPDFALTAENAPAVAQVCRRLDGIPLAIEFAAARLGMMSPHGLAARLDDRFRVLVGGRPTALPRQRTLRATMDWSYVLLDAQEQAVPRALAVFAGGWTMEAAAAVCARDDVPAEAVPVLLEQLLRKSLLAAMAPDRDGDPRFGLLETVRQYARERLDAAGETPAARHRHLGYYLALTRDAAAGWTDTTLATWLARLDREGDNLRTALDCARDDGDIARGLELCVALARYWEMRGQLSEGRAWLDVFIARADMAPTALRATALNAAGNLANRQGDRARATTLLHDALALKRDLGDARGMAMLLNNLGYVEDESGHYARAAALHEESLALKRDLGDQRGVAFFGDVRRNVAKYTLAGAQPSSDVEVAVKQLVSESVAAGEVIDIFAVAGAGRPDMSVLSDAFLEEVRDLGQPNLQFEVLRKLLGDEIASKMRRNVATYRSFKERLEESIRAYLSHSVQSAEVIGALVQMARELRGVEHRAASLGLSDEEVAFYDVLAQGGTEAATVSDTMRALVRELVATIRGNLGIDWTDHETMRARVRAAVKRLLRRSGLTAELEDLLPTIMEQAHSLYHDWPMAA